MEYATLAFSDFRVRTFHASQIMECAFPVMPVTHLSSLSTSTRKEQGQISETQFLTRANSPSVGRCAPARSTTCATGIPSPTLRAIVESTIVSMIDPRAREIEPREARGVSIGRSRRISRSEIERIASEGVAKCRQCPSADGGPCWKRGSLPLRS
jgi:hypothetical protein